MIIKKKKTVQNDVSAKEEQKPLEAQTEFDFSNINFAQREERRKGNRRRGYRRIDDRNLVSRAQEEAISIKENAAKEGYQQGVQMAKNEIAAISEAIADFYKYKSEVFDVVSKDILDIALEIAQKIIKKETSEDKEILLKLIVEVLEKNIGKENKITLKVGSDDVEYLKSKTDEIIQMTQTDAKINIIEDKQITDGGVIIVTTNGIVDASFKTQFELLKEALIKNQ